MPRQQNQPAKPENRAQRTKLLARTLADRTERIKQAFVDRDEAVDLVSLGLLCREHVLLVGPPGTAKTALLSHFGELLDSAPFTYLLTRFTEPSELFGALDVRRFQEDGVYEVNTKGMLPRAHLAFLDEVFQGSSAILNALLTLINERRFHNGGTVESCNLITLLGSSNEVPDDPVLAAFNDRFLLRCKLAYVPDDDVEDVLKHGWAAERELIARLERPEDPDPKERTRVTFGLAELVELQRAVAAVELAPIRDAYAEMVRDLRAQGIGFSDRRAVKAQKAFAASALLRGRLTADETDLAPLAHMWTDVRDEPAMRRILTDHGVPLPESSRRPRELPDIRVDLIELRNRRESLVAKDEYRELMRLLRRLSIEVRTSHPGAREITGEIQRALRETVSAFQERFGDELIDV